MDTCRYGVLEEGIEALLRSRLLCLGYAWLLVKFGVCCKSLIRNTMLT